MSTWWFLTWTGPEIKEKVVNLPGVEYLYDIMSPKEINIPSFVMDFDRKVAKILVCLSFGSFGSF